MANLLLPARQGPASIEVLTALSAGDEMVERLGSITSGGKTLSELVVGDPELFKKWCNTKKTTPEVAEQRAFAKLVLREFGAPWK